MKYRYTALFSVLLALCIMLCACAARPFSDFGKLALYAEGSNTSHVTLEKDETVAISAVCMGKPVGIELMTVNAGESFSVFVYALMTDYATSLTAGAYLRKQTVTINNDNASETVIFEELESGSYIFLIRAESERFTFAEASDISELCDGKSVYYLNGAERRTGVPQMKIVFSSNAEIG